MLDFFTQPQLLICPAPTNWKSHWLWLLHATKQPLLMVDDQGSLRDSGSSPCMAPIFCSSLAAPRLSAEFSKHTPESPC